MELIADDLIARHEALETALAAIPPLSLECIHVYKVREDCVEALAKPTFSNVRFLIHVSLKYEGVRPFTFYITDTGISFTPWMMRHYLTHPIRVVARDWFQACLFQKQQQAAKARMALYKEELMAAAWHPNRVERLLAAGGFGALDD